MNRMLFVRRCIVVAAVCISASVAIIVTDRAEGQNPPPASSQPATGPVADAGELARIRQYVNEISSVRKLGAIPQETTVKHLVGTKYVARLVYSKGNAWRLYLVDGLAFDEIGQAAGERGLDLVFANLMVQPDFAAKPLAAIDQTLAAMSDDYGTAIQRTADIPGYEKRQLARDLEPVIRPRWTYVVQGATGIEATYYIVYTYQPIAGQVFRHEFEITKRGRSVTTVRLAEGIGDAQYLE